MARVKIFAPAISYRRSGRNTASSDTLWDQSKILPTYRCPMS
jgi:hypothetical protein